MSCELTAETSECELSVENVIDAVVENQSVTAVVENAIEAEAQIQQWTIVSDDIYLVEYEGTPPPWFDDMVNEIIDGTGLIYDVAELEEAFRNIEEGYTNVVYDYQAGDKHILTHMESLYLTEEDFNAGIRELSTVYVSQDESGAFFDTLIGAWQTGAGGAWFNERVEVVANVAFSSAKSMSTLTATMKGQSREFAVLQGSIEDLEKQIDGRIETWFVPNTEIVVGENYSTTGPIDGNGNLLVTEEPYATWVANNTVNQHTGDNYVWYEQIGDKKTILGTYQFGVDGTLSTDTLVVYNWFLFTDSVAQLAFQKALEAQSTADGKINSFYQAVAPTAANNPTLGCGDLWTDSNGSGSIGTPSYRAPNTLYRFQPSKDNGLCPPGPCTCGWYEIDNIDIRASVNRLDEATVNINGEARAKSSLEVVTSSGGNSAVAGFVLESNDGISSNFTVYADKFVVTDKLANAAAYPPFKVENGEITFNGKVSFNNIIGDTDFVSHDELLAAPSPSTNTIINGATITTNTVNADRLVAHSVWTDGTIQSTNYSWNGNTNVMPTGFGLFANGTEPQAHGYNIVGSKIFGGEIVGTTIKSPNFIYLNGHGRTFNELIFSEHVASSMFGWIDGNYGCPDGKGCISTSEYGSPGRDCDAWYDNGALWLRAPHVKVELATGQSQQASDTLGDYYELTVNIGLGVDVDYAQSGEYSPTAISILLYDGYATDVGISPSSVIVCSRHHSEKTGSNVFNYSGKINVGKKLCVLIAAEQTRGSDGRLATVTYPAFTAVVKNYRLN